WGLSEDAESMAAFIRQWLSDHGRWNSPRYLLGESFGTTRAALVAELLEDQHMVSLNGIIFVSQALNYAGSTPYVRDNLISHITYVPTMAATAYYHGKVDAQGLSLEEWVDAARNFATDQLLPALWRLQSRSARLFA
ncbi:MAG: carboxypeptidase C (cathepsin A), partial [Halieaceae bacterium]